MGVSRDQVAPGLSEQQGRVISHDSGALLVLGVAGSGRSESLARRLGRLVAEGQRALVLTSSTAAATRIRTRAEETIETPYEELAVHTHPAAAARLLREHATEAEIDPFFESLSPAERLAMLLDRLDELPLRRHEIRGNPAGLLARIVDRIDALKSAGVTAADFARWADQQGGASRSERDTAAREREFAEIYELHDSMLRSAGAMDAIDGVIELTMRLEQRPALAEAVSNRFPHLLVDEAEDACPAERSLIEALARNAETTVITCDDEQGLAPCEAASAWVRRALDPEEIALEPGWRYGGDLLDAAHAVVAPTSNGAETPRRAALRFPPTAAVAAVSGPAAAAFTDALDRRHVEVAGPSRGTWLVRAADHEALADALAATPRPAGRLRVEVDPLRL